MNSMNLPVFSETVNGVDCKIDPAEWTDEQAKAMMEGAYLQGLRIILQRSTAGQSDPKKAIAEKAKALQSGDYSWGSGGGGGPKLDATTRAWIEFFKLLGLKEGGKPVNRNTLVRAQQGLCRQDLIQEHEPGTAERRDVEANIGKYLDERFDAWKAAQEADAEGVGGLIALEKAKDGFAGKFAKLKK